MGRFARRGRDNAGNDDSRICIYDYIAVSTRTLAPPTIWTDRTPQGTCWCEPRSQLSCATTRANSPKATDGATTPSYMYRSSQLGMQEKCPAPSAGWPRTQGINDPKLTGGGGGGAAAFMHMHAHRQWRRVAGLGVVETGPTSAAPSGATAAADHRRPGHPASVMIYGGAIMYRIHVCMTAPSLSVVVTWVTVCAG